ncbi:unnamed protein product [Rotaria sordida]|uniref:RNA polymerase II subunit A C-terminal domain phosphatase n=1 Tax=Rotaria sordida TaxID=392033 RepID=A0A815IAG7_9BILA|nr:unnamed protein product [Rotaria sordida]CAF1365377.1 unnamed protein product [Rotaria sordida]
MIDMNGQRQSFLSPVSGTVTELYVHELDTLSYGSIILEYEECRHTITFKNLCSDCGIDLNQLKNALSALKCTKSVISMEPSFPTVKITAEEALRFDNEERNYLLRKRKLHLLVDLDQTLVHTTNSRIHYPSSSDVIAYQLNTPTSQTFYTKLRPGVQEFLTNLRPFYQFHIVTFGDRPYAHTIAKLIDPNGTFFSHRILSRNECLSLTDKTANLSSLFPCSDSLVCMIDDRDDVWNYAPNLVHVKPYIWFKDVGDINAIHLPSLSISHSQMVSSISEQIENSEDRQQSSEKRKFNKQSDKLSKRFKENSSHEVVDTDLYLYQLEIILKHIHTIFYTAYDQWIQDKHGIMPNLKQIMPNVRRQVLSSVSLCFSHLMPKNYPIEKHRATIMAKTMGATVTHDLQYDWNGNIQTTHVIAGKQTMKVYQALQHNIKVVTPEWLIDCYERWEKTPEENYILMSDYDVRKSRLFTEETPRVSKRRYCGMQHEVSVVTQPSSWCEQITTNRKQSQTNNSKLSNKIPMDHSFDQYTFNMSADECFDVEKEVNELYIGDDDDSDDTHPQPLKRQRTATPAKTLDTNIDDNDDGFESDSTSMQKLYDLISGKRDDNSSDEESLGDDDVPRGWKKVYKKKY